MEIVITSILAFISTNIDDIFLLTLFFSSRRFEWKQVFAGQIVGISCLIIVSLVGSLLELVFDHRYIGVMGLFPIYLGLRGLFGNGDDEDSSEAGTRAGNKILAIALVTIANGGDNVGIYIPLFVTLTWTETSVMILIFLLMTVFWVLLAKYLTQHPALKNSIEKHGKRLTFIVLIMLGVYILYESDVLSLIL